jgi:ATP-binding cassette subfamily B protein
MATLATLPLVGWLTVATRKRLTEGFMHSSLAWADMTSILADTIPGVRVVKAFAQEKREIERFKATNTRIVGINDRVNKLWTFFWPLVAMLNQVGLVVAWGVGVWRVYDQRITVGVLTAFLAYIARFYSRLESMSRMTGRTQRAAASAERIFQVLDREPSVPEPVHPFPPGRIRGEIELCEVGFRFGNRRVLENINLKIRPGEMIGVVGPTGSGKSTLVNLICRFYDVSEGCIKVDGQDIRSFPVLDFRRNIGVVLQDPFLFFGTIADNVAYGRPGASRDEILAAARAARAHEFILQMPDGYDSVVGERGQTLSGGERQRVSIARALLIDPRILILDEATSAVDTQTEIQIQEALDNLVKGRTTIAIAHRLSTLHGADRILVLDGGRIVETGSHTELLAAGGLYRSLYEAQAREEQTKGGVALPDAAGNHLEELEGRDR